MKLLVQSSISLLLFFLFAIPQSYGDTNESPAKYKDWEVDKIGDMIRYSAHG